MIANFFLFAPLATQAAYYLPGETLNPACAPTDSGCGVSSIVGSGTTTQVPYYAANGSVLSATSTFKILSSGTAQATNLTVDTTLTIGSLSGFLKATAGAVATALVNLASDVTGTLPVANGGTGSTTLSGILKGNGTSALSTLLIGSGLTYDGTTLSSLSPATTSSNTWAGTQTFTNAPVLSTFSGLLGANSGTTYQISTSSLSASITGNAATVTNGVYTTDAGTVFLAPNGSAASLTSFPTLNQNTTGTASNVTGTVAAANGGTGSTTLSGLLKGNGTSGVGTVVIGTGLTWDGTTLAGTGTTNYWTSAGGNIYNNTGTNVGIGTTTPNRALTVFNTSANPQQRISYDTTRYTELYTDASGYLNLTATGKTLNFLDGNLYICDGGACPTTPVQGYPTFTSQGNLVAGGTVYSNAFGPATCPSGMIPVPASPADGKQGFCVDKYEAQSSSGNEVSVQGGSPWVSITQTSARAECIRAGKHLITESEWQAIAHNAENVGWNWNGGVAGTNQMSDGHSDSSPASALATAADASPCSGTGQTCDMNTWDAQRRTYKLSNGEYIWDFGGNVWEWVDQTVTNDYPIVNSAVAGWQACLTSGDGVCGNTRTTNDQWYRGAVTTVIGFIRGGALSDGAIDGVFTLNLGNAPSATGSNIGFRCSR